VHGLRVRVCGLGFDILGSWVWVLRFGFWGLLFEIQGFGDGVQTPNSDLKLLANSKLYCMSHTKSSALTVLTIPSHTKCSHNRFAIVNSCTNSSTYSVY